MYFTYNDDSSKYRTNSEDITKYYTGRTLIEVIPLIAIMIDRYNR